MSQQLPQIQLQDVVYQQQDATVFNGAAIPALVATPEAFLIFYLTQTDEQNGYGTVIQLDSETKQAAIFADLNPEYSHLFYLDEQHKLQTLLWCIEFATRNTEGLFVTHAKVYGRGITEDELRAKLAEPAMDSSHQLTEQVTVDPTTGQSAQTVLAPAASAAPMEAPIQPQMTTPPVAPQPAPAATPPVQAPVVMSPPLEAAPTPQLQEVVTPLPAMPPVGQPDLLSMNLAPQAAAPMELNLPPLPNAAPEPLIQSNPTVGPAPMPAPAPMPIPPPAPAQVAIPELNLPPLPDLPAQPTQWAAPAAPTMPSVQTTFNQSQPMPQVVPATAEVPALDLPPLPTMPVAPQAQVARQPVGRPQKPLVQDRLWTISADDFNWLKSISRQPIETHQELLKQKTIQQIQRNKPELASDQQFQSLFEQAFTAVCITYDLVPGLRHDLLKSLLNGRVVDGIIKAGS